MRVSNFIVGLHRLEEYQRHHHERWQQKNQRVFQDVTEEVSIGSYPYFKHGKLGVNVVLRSTDKSLLIKQHTAIVELIKETGGKVFDIIIPE